MNRKRKQEQKKVAKERVSILMSEAEKTPEYANRYVHLARKIAMKVNIKFPRLLQRKFCKYCYSFLNSKNSRVRTTKGKVVITCLECKKFNRIPLSKKKGIK
jgi:ribonuclease P protein subunit RPR2